MSHLFLFTPGIWIGEGRILFSSSPELIRYYTRWTIDPLINDTIVARQLIEIQGVLEKNLNVFTLTSIGEEGFNIQIENDMAGKIKGAGVMNAETIGWEFRAHPIFDGFEVCRLQENGDYMVHAEYTSEDAHRTVIDGRIWKKEI